ncbi:MAG: neutral zinc metallopeptidase [Mucilaginibacter sp.]
MQSRVEKSRREKEEHPNVEVKVQKRRAFTVVGVVLGVAALFVYLVSSAYPERLFKVFRPAEPVNDHAVAPAAHPALPNSALKSSCEAMFASANQVMARQFSKMGKTYTAPSLQLFEDTISAYECGTVLPASGSFYCPADKELFVDLSFFRAVQKRDSLSARWVRAYVIGHQVGHHIEALLGITAKVAAKQAELNSGDYAKLNDKLELLADYYAGVWLHYTITNNFESGDAAALISNATIRSTALAQNTEISVPDPYSYANLGARADAFYHGYLNGTLQNDGIFAPGELK